MLNSAASPFDCRRRDLDDLIMAMDEFVPPGSEVHLYNDVPVGDREVLLLNGGLNVDSLQVRRSCSRSGCGSCKD